MVDVVAKSDTLLFLSSNISQSIWWQGEKFSKYLSKKFHFWHKKLSPACNDVLEAEGWSARCAEVAFLMRFREAKTIRRCLRSNINYPLPEHTQKCPQFTQIEYFLARHFNLIQWMTVEIRSWRSRAVCFTWRGWVRGPASGLAEQQKVKRLRDSASWRRPACFVHHRAGHREQDGEQGQGQGPPARAPCWGQGGHLQCHTGGKRAEGWSNSHPISGLGGSYHGVLHWPWRSSLPRGSTGCH